MAIRVALRHSTRYRYDRPVKLLPQVVRLRPAAHSRTPIEAYSLKVSPEPHFLNWQQDPFGNFLARLVFPENVKEFTVDVGLVANLVTLNPFDFFLEEGKEHYPFTYDAGQLRDLKSYLEVQETGPEFLAWYEELRQKFSVERPRVIDLLVNVNQWLQKALRYDIRLEPGVFSPNETIVRGHGSCRDFAWLLVNLLRQFGIAARFVSGYSIQLVADQKPLEGPAGVSADCTDLHAWAEAYLPGAGWVGLDATSGLLCGEGHIPLACTPDPSEAAPISGSFEFEPLHEKDEAKCDFKVEMVVQRIEDRPRPTKSYSESDWQAILACGHQLDALLEAGDVRLTMGGEPTFVSIDDMESAEWNTEALGPTKAVLSDRLIRKLRSAFAEGGAIVHGQGKWYPGEPLPRWAYSLYFRKDDEPVWRDGSLISDGEGYGADDTLALQFITALTERLGLDDSTILPGYEDAFYYLWRERTLPINVDPFDSKLDNALERARLARIFERGLDQITGYTLPLRDRAYVNGDLFWETGNWFLRRERLLLIAGDSPMGYRLPMDSLPWEIPEERDNVIEPDPFAEFKRPRSYEGLRSPRQQPRKQPGTGPDENPQLPSHGLLRTALCVEPRNGVLHVFLPPVSQFEAWLELLAKIEETTKSLGTKVRLEGYPPPFHPLLERISVTPDPGVIEVNIHPSRTWSELTSRTTTLYELARTTRLGTDKFLLDGRHSGTGGGNHIVLGGSTPQDSPFLRRPELLTSLIAFFNNHPALSYLFSGLFVGPTSQAPRLDEARNDSLYELEIARDCIKAAGINPPSWFVDRTLRHLLTDVTGNTHRAEFCIDKLYSPDSATGRLGLLELRSFEMPPDARMSLAQQLLVRALVANFWTTPYRKRLVRWNTTLHDRFALPHFLWNDLEDALEEIAPMGLGINAEWFRPHWEFRFPLHGRLVTRGLEVELRQAMEPWHVLGEEQVLGGTARYVDSSVERVEVLVNGMTETRHCLVVQGRTVPLVATGRAGEYVGAIRYKAWKPPSSLHPTLDVNVPLIIGIYDRWNGRSIGGLTYHVAHPGGRSNDTFPANGLEAESRRMARFFAHGYPTAEFEPDETVPSMEFPVTLDLRANRSKMR